MNWALSRSLLLLLSAACLGIWGAFLLLRLPAQLLPNLSTRHFGMVMSPADAQAPQLPAQAHALVQSALSGAHLPGTLVERHQPGWIAFEYSPEEEALQELSKFSRVVTPQSDRARASALEQLLRYEASKNQIKLNIRVEPLSEQQLPTLIFAATDAFLAKKLENISLNSEPLKNWIHSFERLNSPRYQSYLNDQVADFYGVKLKPGSPVTQVHETLFEKWNLETDENELKKHIFVLHDQARTINAAESTVMSNLRDGTILTCLCVLLFLRSFKSTFFVSLSLPLSLLAAVPIMHICGLGKNIMSLAGLALGVGVVVDASLAVTEDIHHALRQGVTPFKAAQTAAADNFSPVLAAILTTLAVFVPILFLNGFAGEIFFDLSLTIIIIQILSFGVSIYLIPGILCAYYQKFPNQIKKLPKDSSVELKETNSMVRFVTQILGSRSQNFAVFFASILAVFWSTSMIPGSEFLPVSKNSEYVFTKNISKQSDPKGTNKKIKEVSIALQRFTKSSRIMAYDDRIEVRLSAAHPAQASKIQTVLQDLFYAPREPLVPTDSSGNPSGNVDVYVTPIDPHRFSTLIEKMREVSHGRITGVESSIQNTSINGIAVQKLSLTLAPGMPAGEALTLLKNKMPEWGDFTTDPIAKRKEESLNQLGISVIVAMVFIFFILVTLNRSLTSATTIMFTFLWGLIGVFPGMRIHGESFNASVLVGFILLGGTVVNNGILLMDLFKRHRDMQLAPLEAMVLAVRKRAVPVIVTALTTVLGMVPMVFESGEGSELYRGLAIVTVYGTLVSTPLSLICVPCLALLLDDLAEFLAHLKFKWRSTWLRRKAIGKWVW